MDWWGWGPLALLLLSSSVLALGAQRQASTSRRPHPRLPVGGWCGANFSDDAFVVGRATVAFSVPVVAAAISVSLLSSIHRNIAIKINKAKSYEYPRGREKRKVLRGCRAVREEEEPGRKRKLSRTQHCCLRTKNRTVGRSKRCLGKKHIVL